MRHIFQYLLAAVSRTPGYVGWPRARGASSTGGVCVHGLFTWTPPSTPPSCRLIHKQRRMKRRRRPRGTNHISAQVKQVFLSIHLAAAPLPNPPARPPRREIFAAPIQPAIFFDLISSQTGDDLHPPPPPTPAPPTLQGSGGVDTRMARIETNPLQRTGAK